MNKPVSEATLEELHNKKKSLTGIIAIMSVLGVIYIGFLLFWLVTGNWDSTKTLGVVPLIAMTASMLPALKNLDAVKEEIARRES